MVVKFDYYTLLGAGKDGTKAEFKVLDLGSLVISCHIGVESLLVYL
jgi:hypothetical protein